MLSERFVKYGVTLATVFAFTACGDGPAEPDPDPTVISAFSGDAQEALAGETLGNPITVRVAQGATAVAGTSVTWAVTAGGGSVAPTSSTTDATGMASTTWTLGPSSGTNVVEARATGADGSPVTFNATATDPNPQPSASVSVGDNFFDPTQTLLALNGTVTWTWTGSNTHNVTFTGATSGNQTGTGMSYQRTFDTAGSFNYQCTIHPTTMNGTVTVQ